MEVGCCLVKMALETDDILLAEMPAKEPVIVQSHRLYLFAARTGKVFGERNSAIVFPPVEIHRLAKGDFCHSVMVAVEDKIDAGIWLVRGILRPRLIVQFLQALLVSLLQ